jgi:hypothetical protein
MAVRIKQYGSEPVLMVNFEGQFQVEDVFEMFSQSETYFKGNQTSHTWRLIDLTQSNIQFADVIALVKHLPANRPGDFSDTRFMTIFCPSHPMARLLSELLAKASYGGVHTPIFPGLGEALLFVQDEIDRNLRAEV